MLIASFHELVKRKRDLVGMHCAPGDSALQLNSIVCNRADFYQFVFDDFRVSHDNSSMTHAAGVRS